MQDASSGAGPLSDPPIVDMSALAKVNEAGARTIAYLRSQLSNLQQKLKQVQGVADVAASKQKLAAERGTISSRNWEKLQRTSYVSRSPRV